MTAKSAPARPSRAVIDARAALGVDRLALEIHDACFPGSSDDDIGRGSPNSPAGLALVAFAGEIGFDAVQLGPQGLTGDDDPSPYMGCLFSRNPLSISLSRLADPQDEWGGVLPAARLAALVAARSAGTERRVAYGPVLRSQRAALGAAFECFERGLSAGQGAAEDLAQRLERFASEAGPWLESDSLYEALRGENGGREWTSWQGPRAEIDRVLGDASRRDAPLEARRAELARRHAPALRFYRFVQLVAHEQHQQLRAESRHLGLELIGDLQVGISPRDTWRLPGVFLDGYRLGAPPSRTNTDGQPWGYPVLDPDAFHDPLHDPEGRGDGPAMRFVTERIEKMSGEYDAMRIDHPQGLVCPWVYRADLPDPRVAVQNGARLFSSPDLRDHPELARYSIARREDLASDPATPRYDEHWVARLDDAQVGRYALLFDRLVEVASRDRAPQRAILCEVLSTLPHPLERVLRRHDLGRFRVTQKADPMDPEDVYRAENAEPHDWIMFGNHDTPPLFRLLEEWRADGRLEARAAHAAQRLEPEEGAREAFRKRLLVEPGLMAHAEIAQLFVSPARNVSIFFVDLFGLTQIYNRPGNVSSENWSLRLDPEWRPDHARRLCEDRALNLPLALWLALRSRAGTPPELLRAVRAEAEGLRGGRPLPELA